MGRTQKKPGVSHARLKLSPAADGSFDEVFLMGQDGACLVHVEVMSDNAVWIGLYHDGGKVAHLNISAKGRLHYMLDEDC